MRSLDGFVFTRSKVLLPEHKISSLNRWTYWEPTQIPVHDWLFRPRTVEWKGQKQWVGDYEFFTLVIGGWINDKFFPLTKEQALDLFFEMEG